VPAFREDLYFIFARRPSSSQILQQTSLLRTPSSGMARQHPFPLGTSADRPATCVYGAAIETAGASAMPARSWWNFLAILLAAPPTGRFPDILHWNRPRSFFQVNPTSREDQAVNHARPFSPVQIFLNR